MVGDYYDVQSILAEEERVPTVFRTPALELGFLDCTSDGNGLLSAGAKAELPLWLATRFADKLFVHVDAPKCFCGRFRTYLLADPTVVNLRERSASYYDTGFSIAGFVGQDCPALTAALIRTLAMRFADILDKAQNSRNEDISNLTRGMTNLERRLFEAGHRGADEMYHWKRRDSTRVVAAAARGLKRKLA